MWVHRLLTKHRRTIGLPRYCMLLEVMAVQHCIKVELTVKQAVNFLPRVFVFHMKLNAGFMCFVIRKL